MFSLLPMITYFISAFVVRYFKLNNHFLEQIKVELAKRELNNGSSPHHDIERDRTAVVNH